MVYPKYIIMSYIINDDVHFVKVICIAILVYNIYKQNEKHNMLTEKGIVLAFKGKDFTT